jgi:hypothetical protein
MCDLQIHQRLYFYALVLHDWENYENLRKNMAAAAFTLQNPTRSVTGAIPPRVQPTATSPRRSIIDTWYSYANARLFEYSAPFILFLMHFSLLQFQHHVISRSTNLARVRIHHKQQQ